jgi:hypothetical protein
MATFSALGNPWQPLLDPLMDPRPLPCRPLRKSEFGLMSALAAGEPRATVRTGDFSFEWKVTHSEALNKTGSQASPDPIEYYACLISGDRAPRLQRFSTENARLAPQSRVFRVSLTRLFESKAVAATRAAIDMPAGRRHNES